MVVEVKRLQNILIQPQNQSEEVESLILSDTAVILVQYNITDPTTAEEDFADTFATFVIKSINYAGIAEAKVDWFYSYPELVNVRQAIINEL